MRFNPDASEAWRLFIALPFSKSAREVIRDAQSQLTQHNWPVKWVDPELAHVTLKFLGNVGSDLVPVIGSEISGVAGLHRATEAIIEGVGAFPTPERARVFWLGLSGAGIWLESLAGDIDGAMSRIGFTRETRPFRAHITLGRVRRGKDIPPEAAGVIKHLDVARGTLPLDRVQLVRSVLSSTGPSYTVLNEWRLGTGRAQRVTQGVELVEHG